ncbi:MAG: sugar ABC transporter permease [Polyangiaceae bacterium]|nr:sugar ABC transporter permease [Polyangiaceae bacterium]
MTRTRSEDRRGYFFVLPTVIVLVVVAVYPMILAAWISLRRVVIVFHEDHFVGLSNYAFLVRDPRFWTALGNTTYFTVVAVIIELLLGLGFALLLHTSFRGQKLFRAAILIPWAIPTVVSAKMWSWIWNPEYGLISRTLPNSDINWLGMPGYAMHAAILVDVWKTTPFVALLLFAGLETIPTVLYKAAAVDGASSWRTFFFITLPLLRPTLVVVLVFRTLDAFRIFDAVYVLTGGGPANTTETLSIYAYKMLMRSGDFGYGSTLAVATFLCVMAISAIYIRMLGMPSRSQRS